jgi:hypothetical protein
MFAIFNVSEGKTKLLQNLLKHLLTPDVGVENGREVVVAKYGSFGKMEVVQANDPEVVWPNRSFFIDVF